ncbi:MAG: hypothetical protein COZ57_01860 [Armatimonadetes bacterium CG_4_8_14_3_um_filter_66_20]|nr:MAG: hypothetical protein COZ57_01860 [Armatimonadetes bacterium CG_4_8_14_3_um_filter_66_20]
MVLPGSDVAEHARDVDVGDGFGTTTLNPEVLVDGQPKLLEFLFEVHDRASKLSQTIHHRFCSSV